MLILTRKVGEIIMIGEDIVVKVLGVRSGQVKIGIEAPREMPVHRQEIFDRIKSEGAEQEANNDCVPCGQSARTD